MAYDSAQNIVRTINPNHITGVAGGSMQKFYMYRAVVLRRVSALVVTAGTNAAAAVDVYNGTTSVGSLAFGTETAGTTLTTGALNVDVPAGSYIELQGAATSATLVGAFQIEIQDDDTP